jgi:nickel transport protein
MRRLLVALSLLPLTSQALAHEVHAATHTETLTIVTLTYANGKPFAYEQFEVTPAGTEVPSQVGRTDASGRAAILSIPGQALEFTASAKDGHGTRMTLPPAAAESASPAPAGETPRWLLLSAGGGVIFGLFGLIQLYFTRRRRTDK